MNPSVKLRINKKQVAKTGKVTGLKYKNVTISGLPGSGSTTLGGKLAEKLNWKYFSGGDFLRAYAIKEGLLDSKSKLHHDQSIMKDEADFKMDFMMREMLQVQHGNILDSWLSGFMAQGIKGTLKVLMLCSDDSVRVDRIMNRDKIDVEDAKRHIFNREEKNVTKWRRIYAKQWDEWVVKRGVVSRDSKIDFWNGKLYDLVIDTYSHSREETLRLTLEALGYDQSPT